jgi:CRP-like cAMP-binding protein
MPTTPNLPIDQLDPPSEGTTSDGADRRALLNGNHLLAVLSSQEMAAAAAAAERVRMRMRQLLFAQGDAITHAYFPVSGVVSLMADMADGEAIETLTVGNEGMIGLSAVLGSDRSPTRALCQIAGVAIRIPIAALLQAAPPGGTLHGRLLRYAEARLTSLSRSVACNRLHSARQRYARWVLTTHDRMGGDEFPITQELMGQMLGVTRPTISLVGGELQAAGLIHGGHGRITVDDRAGLERVACECYSTVRSTFRELLGEHRG